MPQDANVKLLNFLSALCEHIPDGTSIGGIPSGSKFGLDTQSFMWVSYHLMYTNSHTSHCYVHVCSITVGKYWCVFDGLLCVNVFSCRFRDFSDIWLSSRLPSDLLKTLEGSFTAINTRMSGETSTVVKEKKHTLEQVTLDTLQIGLKTMACLSGWVAIPACISA